MESQSHPADTDNGLRANDCWNTIGVPGDRSCPELKRYVHCRNCPVQQSAALELLTRVATDWNTTTWDGHDAVSTDKGEDPTASVLIFRLGAERLALPTSMIEEIVEPRTIHSIPHRNAGALLGLVNVRGRLTLCVSLARVLGLASPTEVQARTNGRLLLIRRKDIRVASPVDEVFGVHKFASAELKEIPQTLAHATAHLSKHLLVWRDHSVALFDDGRLFAAVEQNLL